MAPSRRLAVAVAFAAALAAVHATDRVATPHVVERYRYTYSTVANPLTATGPSQGLTMTVAVLEIPPLQGSQRALELVLGDLQQTVRTGSAAVPARIPLPPDSQAAFSRPFFVLLAQDDSPSEVLYDPDDDASVITVKKSVVAFITASLPELPEQLARRSLSSPTSWEADEHDHTGFSRPLYTAETLTAGGRGGKRSLLRVTRDVTLRRFYRTPAEVSSKHHDSGYPLGSVYGHSVHAGVGDLAGRALSGIPGSSGRLDPDGVAGLVQTTEYLLSPVSRRRGGGAPASRPSRLLLGHVERVTMAGLSSIFPDGAARHAAAAVPGGGSGGDGVGAGESATASVPEVHQHVDVELEHLSSRPVAFVCSAEFASSSAAGAAACGAIDADAAVDIDLADGEHAVPSDQLGNSHAFSGPRMLAAAIAADSAALPLPGSGASSGGARRLVATSLGLSLVREPFVMDAHQQAAAGAAAQQGPSSAARNASASSSSPPAGADSAAEAGQMQMPSVDSTPFGQRLSEEAIAAANGESDAAGSAARLLLNLRSRAATAAPSPLELVFDALRCFPAAFHDDEQPRPGVLEADVLPCVHKLHTVTVSHPHALVAMQALLLRSPCDAVTLSSAGAAQRASALVGGAPLWPSPCMDEGANPYAVTQLSDRMVLACLNAVVASPHVRTAHGILAHMLTRPDAYRYPTVMEHALTTSALVQAPSAQLLQALLALTRGLEELDAAAHELAAAAAASAGQPAPPRPLLHDNELKAQAVLITAGLIGRARGGMAQPGSALSAEEVLASEASLVSYLYGQYASIATDAEARRKQEEVVSELIVALWHMIPDQEKHRWRARARDIPLREAETVWVTAELTLADRTAWDASAMAAWRDLVLQDIAANPSVLGEMRLLVLAQLSAVLDAGGAPLLAVGDGASAKRRLHTDDGVMDDDAFAHARRLAHAGLAATHYDHAQWQSSLSSTNIILRAFGSLGSPQHLSLILNYTSHADPNVRASAIEALRGLPADHRLPGAYADGETATGGRRLRSATARTAKRVAAASQGAPPPLRALFAGLEAYVSPAVAGYVEASVAEVEAAHSAHRVSAVFGDAHVAAGVAARELAREDGPAAPDVEAAALASFLAVDALPPVRVAALNALSHMRPLHPATVDALMTFLHDKLDHVATERPFDAHACGLTLMARRPECRVMSLSRCFAECEFQCQWDSKIAMAIGRLLSSRLHADFRSEARRLAIDAAAGVAANVSYSRALSAAAERLRQAELHAPKSARTGRSLQPRDYVIDPLEFASHVTTPQPAGGEASAGGARHHGRALQGAAAAVATTMSGSRRLWRTSSGSAPAELVERARGLGYLTLFQAEFGRSYGWEKSVGDMEMLGAGILLSLVNRASIKIGPWIPHCRPLLLPPPPRARTRLRNTRAPLTPVTSASPSGNHNPPRRPL